MGVPEGTDSQDPSRSDRGIRRNLDNLGQLELIGDPEAPDEVFRVDLGQKDGVLDVNFDAVVKPGRRVALRVHNQGHRMEDAPEEAAAGQCEGPPHGWVGVTGRIERREDSRVVLHRNLRHMPYSNQSQTPIGHCGGPNEDGPDPTANSLDRRHSVAIAERRQGPAACHAFWRW